MKTPKPVEIHDRPAIEKEVEMVRVEAAGVMRFFTRGEDGVKHIFYRRACFRQTVVIIWDSGLSINLSSTDPTKICVIRG